MSPLQVPLAGNNNRVVTNITPATPPVARPEPDQVWGQKKRFQTNLLMESIFVSQWVVVVSIWLWGNCKETREGYVIYVVYLYSYQNSEGLGWNLWYIIVQKKHRLTFYLNNSLTKMKRCDKKLQKKIIKTQWICDFVLYCDKNI